MNFIGYIKATVIILVICLIALFALKKAHIRFFPAILYFLSLVSVCLCFACLDLQFALCENNDYLSAVFPLISVFLQVIPLKIIWEIYNHNIKRFDSRTGKATYLVSLAISVIITVVALLNENATLLVWIYCLSYPLVSIASIYISPDLAFESKADENENV